MRPLLKSTIVKSKVNRPLGDEEEANHLPQKQRSPCEPWYQLSVIRMNSTYLECPDVGFGMKGFATIVALPLIIMPCKSLLYSVYIDIIRWSSYSEQDRSFYILFSIFFSIVVGLMVWAMLWLLTRECFRYTHYPMRFNRKTRKVHVFRDDGSVMTEDWDKIFFTTGSAALGDRKVNGLRLSEDGKTVVEGFVLPFVVDKNEPMSHSQWEFVRRYMEEPDALPHLAGQVEHIMDIYDRRESWWNGFHRFLMNITDGSFFMTLLATPLAFLFSIGRWIAVQTCTIPVWPEEVEAECRIEPNDPYLRDRDHLAKPGTAAKA